MSLQTYDRIGGGYARRRQADPRIGGSMANGSWNREHADLLVANELDVGYRLVICDDPPRSKATGR